MLLVRYFKSIDVKLCRLLYTYKVAELSYAAPLSRYKSYAAI